MFEIFPKLWTIVYEAKPIEQLGVALSLLPILLSWVLWLGARVGTRSAYEQLANANDRIKILEQNRDEAIAARKVAEAERDALSPDHWLRVSAKEQAQGNEEKAMAVLAQGFAGVRSGMAHTALALAGHHLSQVIGLDRAFHLDEGERFARMAALLDPGDADAAALAEEAAMERIDDGEDVDVPELSASYLPTDPGEATQLIYVLCDHAYRKMEQGHYRLGYRLSHRAEMISTRAGLFDQKAGWAARFHVSQMLCSLGDYHAAFDMLKALLPVQERVLGVEHPNVLAMHYLEAEVLGGLGEHGKAFERLTASLPSHERVLGAEHPDVLNARALEACVLESLGEHSKALERLTALLPVQERVLGAANPNVLAMRALRDEIRTRIPKPELPVTPAEAGAVGAMRETS